MASQPPFVPRSGLASHAIIQRRNHWQEISLWWREIDRVLLVLILTLMAIGAAAVAASSPASASKLSTAKVSLGDLYFFWTQVKVQILGIIVMIGASFLPKHRARQAGIVLGLAMLVALVLVLVPHVGTTVKGSRRWLNLGMSFQPSEFLKPAYAILMAWILSWRLRDPNLPVIAISTGLMIVVAALLLMEPDFGSTVLFAGVWFVLVMLSGMPIKRMATICGAGLLALIVTYFVYDNARHRIDSFLFGGTAYDQVDLAHRTLTAGGWTGSGLWLGIKKLSLPEAHTDYIFSVIGEEFGLLVCLVIIALYLAIVVRVLLRLVEEEDLFTLLAAAGLTAQIGGQAFINILVNLGLFPSKGMTLPLISYGGSSTLALCLGVGFLLAITRRNPFLKRERFSLREAGAML